MRKAPADQDQVLKRSGISMNIIIDADDLQIIADEIMSGVRMLELSDEDTAEDDIGIYLPRIRRAADDLNSLVADGKPAERGERQ